MCTVVKYLHALPTARNSKIVRTAGCDTIYTIYLSLSTKSAVRTDFLKSLLQPTNSKKYEYYFNITLIFLLKLFTGRHIRLRRQEPSFPPPSTSQGHNTFLVPHFRFKFLCIKCFVQNILHRYILSDIKVVSLLTYIYVIQPQASSNTA